MSQLPELNPSNALKLAKRVVDYWSTNELRDFAVGVLIEKYLANKRAFEKDIEDFLDEFINEDEQETKLIE